MHSTPRKKRSRTVPIITTTKDITHCQQDGDGIMEKISLNHEASAGDTNKQTTTTLPAQVVQCLENARFLHLATCVDNQPHVSLMNYTYLPSATTAPDHPTTAPIIVMTSNPASKKTHNILANPKVSLLVHDWVSHRPLTRRMSQGSALSEDGGGGSEMTAAENPPSSLASLLLNLNTAAVSSISATINGVARLLPEGSAEEAFYRQKHLVNNAFDADPVGPNEARIHQQLLRSRVAPRAANSADTDPRPHGGRAPFVEGEEVRVIVVSIQDIRISDWKGHVWDWVLQEPERFDRAAGRSIANGVVPQ